MEICWFSLHPWIPEIVLSRFTKKEESRPSSGSSTSILKAEDWRKNQILQVVSDVYDRNTRKLNNTMHHLSTENNLLKLHCEGLENALQNEEKRVNVTTLFSLNYVPGGMVMQYFILLKRSNTLETFEQKRRRLYSLLRQLKRKISYAGSRRRKQKDNQLKKESE
jgi:hypothetical protein